MAIARVKNWIVETLTASDLNAEFNNVVNYINTSLGAYSEGTFTPGLTFGGASTGITATTAVGRYVKIGKLVCFWLHYQINSKGSATGTAAFTGLPFTSDNTDATYAPCSTLYLSLDLIAGSILTPLVDKNATTITLYECADNAGQATADDTAFTAATTNIRISGQYMAAS